MKATGIVRRIDDLGRVVIPKEIRRMLRIREGDPLEIFTDKNSLVLKKYSPIKELEEFAINSCEALNCIVNETVIIVDTDKIIATSGRPKKDYIDAEISSELYDIISKNKEVYLYNKKDSIIPICNREIPNNYKSIIIAPIYDYQECLGAVIITSEKEYNFSDLEPNLAKLTAIFLAKQMQD